MAAIAALGLVNSQVAIVAGFDFAGQVALFQVAQRDYLQRRFVHFADAPGVGGVLDCDAIRDTSLVDQELVHATHHLLGMADRSDQ